MTIEELEAENATLHASNLHMQEQIANMYDMTRRIALTLTRTAGRSNRGGKKRCPCGGYIGGDNHMPECTVGLAERFLRENKTKCKPGPLPWRK